MKHWMLFWHGQAGVLIKSLLDVIQLVRSRISKVEPSMCSRRLFATIQFLKYSDPISFYLLAQHGIHSLVQSNNIDRLVQHVLQICFQRIAFEHIEFHLHTDIHYPRRCPHVPDGVPQNRTISSWKPRNPSPDVPCRPKVC